MELLRTCVLIRLVRPRILLRELGRGECRGVRGGHSQQCGMCMHRVRRLGQHAHRGSRGGHHGGRHGGHHGGRRSERRTDQGYSHVYDLPSDELAQLHVVHRHRGGGHA